MVATRRLWRGIFLVVTTLWAWVLTATGLIALLDWPARFPAYAGFCRDAGCVLVALGIFVCGLVADRIFPQVHPWMALAVELGALVWALVIFAGAVLGVLH